MLQQLELEAHAKRAQSEITAVNFDNRRLADMRSDKPLRRRYLLPVYRLVVMHDHFGASLIAVSQTDALTSVNS
ncbi:hypothetical protein [Bradyrhizobium lablabi]|uniref:hypothetical protein n=1 Tax=Bradyrhizobium lablabi TaxID=722472 RepID=UPI001FCDAC06|nr:hypothetical protein [Bradyrhizobium lablabi]